MNDELICYECKKIIVIGEDKTLYMKMIGGVAYPVCLECKDKKGVGGGNYLRDLREKINKGEIKAPKGIATVVDVYHDEWCEIWKSGSCNCNAEARLSEKRN